MDAAADQGRGGRGANMRALVALGVPLVASHLAQFAIHMTDTLMIGRYDITALAGLSLAGPLYFVIFIVGSGFAFAVMPMVAAAAARGDDRQVRRVTRMGLWLSGLYGLLMLPVLVNARPILAALGQEPEVAEAAGRYLGIVGWGLLPGLGIMCLKSFLSALEHMRIVLLVTVATALLNIPLNYALIFGNWGAPELGIAGAAIASVILQVLAFAWFGLYAQRRLPAVQLFLNPWRPDGEAFRRVFRLGWPIGLTNLAETALFTAASIMVGWLGAVPLAAHGIALQIASATFMVHVGLSQAVTVLAGRAYGRGDRRDLARVGRAGLVLSMSAVALTVAVFLLAPDLLVGAFVDPDDPARPAILALGATLLAAAALFQVMDATQVMTLGLLRGVQDTRVPMLLAAVGYWALGVPASYGLGFVAGWGALGVWGGLVLGLALTAALLSWRFWTRSARI